MKTLPLLVVATLVLPSCFKRYDSPSDLPKDPDGLCKVLQHRDESTRYMAARHLALLDTRAASAKGCLLDAYEGEQSEDVRSQILSALAWVAPGDADAEALVLKALQDPATPSTVRQVAAQSLARFGTARAAAGLIAELARRDADGMVQLAAVVSLEALLAGETLDRKAKQAVRADLQTTLDEHRASIDVTAAERIEALLQR